MFNRPVTEHVFRRIQSALNLLGPAALILLCLAGISSAASIKAVPSVSAAGFGETFAVDIVVDGIPANGLGTVQFRLNASAPSTLVTGVSDPSLGSPANISFVTPLAIGSGTPTRSGIGDFFWNARSTNGVLFIDNETFQNGSALYSLSHTNGAVLPSGSGTIARFLVKVGATVSTDHMSITLSDVALLNGDVVYPLDAATGADVQLRCKTTVPSLLGLSSPDAMNVLTSNQLVLGNIYELDNTSGALALNVVLEQSVPSENSAFCGDPVNLAINTPPAGSISINAGSASTNTRDVTLALGCSDTISGCSQMMFSNDNATWTAPETYSSTKTWQLSNGDGQKTVYVKYKDGVGNASPAYSAGITLAMIPPITTATPAGGLYKTTQTVTLSANEPATIYYTTDGTAPTTGSPVYSGPISIAQTATIRFFAVSTFGNPEGVKSATYTIDGLAPVLTLSTLPDGSYSNNAILNIAGTASDANGIQSVVVSGQTVTTSTSDNVNYTFSYPVTLATGSNVVTTVATDNAGNTTTDTRTIILDLTAPQITITNPADNSVVSNPSVTMSGTMDKTATILVSINSGPAVTAATNATTFSLPVTLATNTYNTIIVYATDLAGNSSTAKRTVTHDDTNPALAITIPNQDMGTNQASVLISGTVSDLTTVSLLVTCPTASIGVVSTPTSTTWSVDITNMQQGTNTVTVQATDKAGNSTSVIRNIIYNSTPVTIDPVISPTNNRQQQLTGTMELNSTVTVSCSTAAVGTITYPTTTTWQAIIHDMTEGANIISATATDLEGRTSDPITTTIVLDIQAPATSITSGPAVLTTMNTAGFSFMSTENGSTFECRLDSGMYSVCVSPMNYISLIDGTHTFMVRATDPAGNTDQTPASFTWTVDTIPPTAVIIGAPPSLTNMRSASLTVAGEDVVAYKYLLDTGVFSAETSTSIPIELSGLLDGTHKVLVTGKDSAGNWQSEATATVATWTVDITPPVLIPSTLGDGSYTNNPVLNIAGTASDANGIQSVVVSGQTVTLSTFDNVNYTFSQAVSLATGSNTITAVATDIAGNTAMDTRTIILDRTSPVITIINPADNSVVSNPSVAVSGTTDKTATILISLNSGPTVTAATNATTFSQPVTLATNTNNTIFVYATDHVGNPSAAKRSVTHDDTNPALAITNPNQDMGTNQAGVLISGTVSDLTSVSLLVTCPTASIGVVSTPTSTTWSVDITNMQQGTNTVTVQATDQAGNSTSAVRNIISSQTPVTIDPLRTPTNNSQQQITGTMELNSTVTVSCSTAAVGTIIYPDTTTWQTIIAGMAEGANIISAIATDLEGNTSNPVTATIVFDTQAPITTPSPAPGSYYDTLTLTLAANEPATIYYTMDGSTPTTASPVYSAPIVITSSTTFKFFAIDTASNRESVKSATYTINSAPLIITTQSPLPDGMVGVLYNLTLTATGGKAPYTWAATLPNGMVLNSSTGVISGTPPIAGTFSATVTVTDANGATYSKVLTITIYPALTVTTSTLMYGIVGTSYNQTVEAIGGKTPYTWSLASGNLPSGLTLDGTTGILSGTPASAGSSCFTVQVVDALSVTATGQLCITIHEYGWTIVRPTTPPLPDGIIGTPYSRTLTATGGDRPYIWWIWGGNVLPPGLSLNSSTGVISGTPTAAGTFNFLDAVEDANYIVQDEALSITIYAPLSITTSSLPGAEFNLTYNRTLYATGGKTPYTWSIASGSLPTGLSLNASTGVISGTCTAAGTFNFTVQATDANSTTATKTLSITIYAPLSITTSSLPNVGRNSAYSQTLAATGGKTPYTWSIISGSLPTGLSLNASTGVISGKPTQRGTYSFTVKVTDANAIAATKSLSITVN